MQFNKRLLSYIVFLGLTQITSGTPRNWMSTDKSCFLTSSYLFRTSPLIQLQPPFDPIRTTQLLMPSPQEFFPPWCFLCFFFFFAWLKFHGQSSIAHPPPHPDTLGFLSCHCACSVKSQSWLNPTFYLLLKGYGKTPQCHCLISLKVHISKYSLNASQLLEPTDFLLPVTTPHVFFCLQTFHISFAIFMATDPAPLRILRVSKDNFHSLLLSYLLTYQHVRSYSLILAWQCRWIIPVPFWSHYFNYLTILLAYPQT